MKIKRKLTSFVLAGIMAVMSCSTVSASALKEEQLDVNGDGRANIADAVLIMQYLGGSFEPTDLTKYDVDKNGVVSDMDACIIQLYAAGVLEVEK